VSGGSTTGWATPQVVQAQVERAWSRGLVLRALVAANVSGSEPGGFPLRVRLLGPTGEEIADDFVGATSWARQLSQDAAERGWRLERRAVRAGALGIQQIPRAGYVDTPEQALKMLGRTARSDAATYRTAIAQALDAGDWAVEVALARPFEVLAAAPDWQALLRLTAWLREHPRPGAHPRALPVPGVHSKLTETRRPLLQRLLLAALPAEAIDREATTFEQRFGFAGQPRQVRLRAAGAAVGLSHLAEAEVEWPLTGLAGLNALGIGIRQVVIVENLQPFREVPLAPGRLVLWGQGYGAADLLAALPWLPHLEAIYWGDLDTHGLAILDAVRTVAPHTRSVLMDLRTLADNIERAGRESSPRHEPLPRLNAAEAGAFQALLDGKYGVAVRLEQEHLPAASVERAFDPAPQA
jgi:hypothetical protein